MAESTPETTPESATDESSTDETSADANPSDDGGTDRAVIDAITPDDPSTTSKAVRAPSESAGEQPLPAVPDEATMITLRIRRFDAGSGRGGELGQLRGPRAARPTGCSTCCTT